MARDPVAYAAAIKRRLSQIPPAVQAAIRDANRKSGGEMVGLAQRLAPVLKTPSAKRQAGALRDSIHTEPGDGPMAIRVVAGSAAVFYARFVEFGTRPSAIGQVQGFSVKSTLARGLEAQARRRRARRTHSGTKPQPFFFPAYRALKKSAKARAARAASKAIRAAAS